jgi:flagellar basal-body rod protein FlgG
VLCVDCSKPGLTAADTPLTSLLSLKGRGWVLLALAVALAAAGCGNRDRDYVTRKELEAALGPRTDLDGVGALKEIRRIRAEMQASIEELIKRALTAKTLEERTRALMAANELDVSGLKDTLMAIQKAVDVYAEDLANLGTPGYKRRRVIIRDGGRQVTIERDFAFGRAENTGRSLDVCIMDSRSLFTIQMPDGTIGYTRDGCFDCDAAGNIVTSQGYKLLPGFVVPQDAVDLSIDPDGQVEAVFGNGPGQILGQIQLATFNNLGGLEPTKGTLFKATKASGPEICGTPGGGQFGELHSGFIESSNVSVAETLIATMRLHRWFEAIGRVIDDSRREPSPPKPAKPGP